MADKKRRGMLFVVAGAIFEMVAIVLFVAKTVEPVIAIGLLVVGTALVAVGVGTLRKDRDEHSLKRPERPI